MSEQEITLEDLARMVKGGFDSVGKQINELKTDVGTLKTDVSYLRSQMVTKDFLDDRLANHYGDIVVLFRKEDRRFSELVSILVEKAVLSGPDVQRLDKLRPLVAVD